MLNWQKLGFYLLPPLLALIVVMGVNFKTDLSAFILAGEKTESILLASEMQIGSLSKRYLISIGSETNGIISHIFIKKLKGHLKSIDGVVDVWLPNENKAAMKSIQRLYSPYANALYSLNPEQDLAQLFSQNGLEQRAKFLKNALLSSQGTLVKKIALQDPLLLTLNGFQGLHQPLKIATHSDEHYQNLVLETAMAGLDVPQQKRVQAEIQRVFTDLNVSFSKQYQLEMTGVAVFAVATQTLIQGDIVLVSVLSSIVLMLLFLLIFRSFSILFQVFSILLIVMLTAIITVQLVFGYVHGMTVAIGSTLVGICIDYPIHAIAHAHTVSPKKRLAMIAKVWPSMVLGGMTTLIGYIALGISGYPGFQQVAVYAASGIIVSLLLTRFIFPHLITTNSCRQLNIPWVSVWAKWCQRFHAYFIAALIIMFLGALFSLKSLHWMQDMQALTPELDYLKQQDKRIRERMTSIEPGRFVLIIAKDVETVLQRAEKVYAVLDQLKKTGGLTDYYGLYPWILSSQQQQQNQSLLKSYLSSSNLLMWQQALKKHGLSVEKLGHFKYPISKPIRLEQVLASPVKKLIDTRVIKNQNEAIAMLWLAEHQPKSVKLAVNSIEGVQYFSQRDMLNEMTQNYTDRAKTLLMIGLGFIILLLMIRYKNLLKTLQTLLPSVLAAIFILGFWSFTGVAISFLHLVGFLLVVAICVDYGIFYQENRGGDIKLTYQAMAASMLTSSLAFGSLMLSESTSLKILASVVVLGVILGFLFCPLIISLPQKNQHNRNVK